MPEFCSDSNRVFLTGTTGFIGSKLVELLLSEGFHVRGLSRQCSSPGLPPGYEKTEQNLWQHPNFQWVCGDIRDRQSLRKGMDGCDYVFHLAAYAKNWAKTPETYTKTNVHGLENILETAHEAEIKRIVWTSSIVSLGPSRFGEIRCESDPRITNRFYTEYEQSKYEAEQKAFQWINRGIPLIIVNPTRVYGPGQLSEGNALAQFILDYTQGRAPFMPNWGVNIGNYGFVYDVAKGHILALKNGKIGQQYILGGENVSLKDFLILIDEVSGKKHLKIPLFHISPLLFAWFQKVRANSFGVYPRITPGWVRTFLVDWTYTCDKAKTELKYDPIPLRQGLEITWKWLERVQKHF